MQHAKRDWLRLPSRIAMLLGLGAVSVTGAKAALVDTVHPGADGAPQQHTGRFGDVLMWIEGSSIYISEVGRSAEQLQLGDTAEAAALRELLQRSGATAARPSLVPGRVLLAGAGGSGIHWQSQRAAEPDKSSAATGGGADKSGQQGEHTADRGGPTPAAGAGDK